MEVLTEMNWYTVESELPTNRMYSFLFHDGTVYCFTKDQFFPSAGATHIDCKLESLLAACANMQSEQTSLWEEFGFLAPKSNLVSFGQHLVACDPISGTLQAFLQRERTRIAAGMFTPWMLCGYLPVRAHDPDVPQPMDIADPSAFYKWFLYTTGDQLVVICRKNAETKVYRGSLKSK